MDTARYLPVPVQLMVTMINDDHGRVTVFGLGRKSGPGGA